MQKKTVLSLVIIAVLSGCTSLKLDEKAPLTLVPASYSDLPGWVGDSISDVLPALKNSCARIMKSDPAKIAGVEGIGGTYQDWHVVCTDLENFPAGDNDLVRSFIETNFRPYAARAGFIKDGLFTGYYEPALSGSRVKEGIYQTPIYIRPTDLIMVDLGQFRDTLKGERIAGRVIDGTLKPYEDRAAIEAGALEGKGLELVYVDDPVGAFFLQVQGSGRIRLTDGTEMRVGYAAQNGHVYTAIGRELVKRGVMDKDSVSMQAIRAWMIEHPQDAQDLMNVNKSYVFFQELTGEGPLGAEGVPLTPGRSLAVDRSKIPYGLPVWIDAEAPLDSSKRFRRLMVAQDTGGAIRGAVRGDVFFGYGPEAETLAGHMKSEGRAWILIPQDAKKSRVEGQGAVKRWYDKVMN